MTTTTKQRRPLTVYKASAGSGKTFTLAVEYISLLVSDPENYRHILAVTFTNKATQEMKLRILSQLYGIANSLPGSDTYMEKVMEQTGLGAMAVRTHDRHSRCSPITTTSFACRRSTPSFKACFATSPTNWT